MFQHAVDDVVGTAAVLGDLFKVAAEQTDQLGVSLP
jgi:hypothetical protein